MVGLSGGGSSQGKVGIQRQEGLCKGLARLSAVQQGTKGKKGDMQWMYHCQVRTCAQV